MPFIYLSIYLPFKANLEQLHRCDQKKPACSFCETIGAECISDPADLSTFDPASLAIIERLEGLERKIDSLKPGGSPIVGNSPEIHACSPADNSTSPSVRRDPEHFLPQNLDKILTWPVFRDVSLPTASTPNVYSSPAPMASASSVPATDEELTPAACARWLDNFFSQVHPKNPILDEHSARRLVRKVCMEGVGWDAESCLVLLVCANGALSLPFNEPSLTAEGLKTSIATSLFVAAQRRLGPIVGQAGVVQAQCLFLAGVFLMSALRPLDAWRMFLQSLAICQNFSFCRTSKFARSLHTWSSTPAEESVYWSSWKSERELRSELGLPDFSSPSLDPPRLFPSLPDGCEGDSLRAWYFYLSEISLWRLETDAKNVISSLLEEIPGPILPALAEKGYEHLGQVEAWQDSLAPAVSFGREPRQSENDVLRFILRGRTTYMKEMITWPFVWAVVNGGTQSLLTREWAAKAAAFHLERININRSGFFHRHHGTWLMLRTSARSACILLAMAQLATTSDLLPPNWLEAVNDTISMLMFWREDVQEAEATAELLSTLLLNSQQHQR